MRFETDIQMSFLAGNWEDSKFLFSKFHKYCNGSKTCGKRHPLVLCVVLPFSLLI